MFIGGDVVNTLANELKNCLLKIIDEMALSSDIFNLSGKPAFCRKSKFNFSTLIQFILSFGSNSLGHEIGGEPEDTAQHVVEIVRDPAGQQADRLHPLRVPPMLIPHHGEFIGHFFFRLGVLVHVSSAILSSPGGRVKRNR